MSEHRLCPETAEVGPTLSRQWFPVRPKKPCITNKAAAKACWGLAPEALRSALTPCCRLHLLSSIVEALQELPVAETTLRREQVEDRLYLWKEGKDTGW